MGSFQWFWSRENRTKFITEMVRSQPIKAMLKETYGQDEDQILAFCRSLYLKIKDSYPTNKVPSKVRSRLQCAMYECAA
jgi:hypothetical protein